MFFVVSPFFFLSHLRLVFALPSFLSFLFFKKVAMTDFEAERHAADAVLAQLGALGVEARLAHALGLELVSGMRLVAEKAVAQPHGQVRHAAKETRKIQ